MGPKDRRVRKIDIPTDSVPEFELGDTAVDIKRRREKREAREREEEAQKQRKRKPGVKKYTCKRREWQKKGQGQTKVTQKQRLQER